MELSRNNNDHDSPMSGAWFTALQQIGTQTTAILVTLEGLSAQGRELKDDVKDHELRIRTLERRIWLAVGASSGIAGGIAAFLAKILGA